ncbi:MAG TPA: cytochrome c peroxidase [Vicinamibacterales bacterium]|jgi:cytochrome c peroxidase
MKRRVRWILALTVVMFVAMLTIAARGALVVTAAAQTGARGFTPPRGLDKVPITVPDDNAMTADRIELGKQLFFDMRLSRTKKMSCETCHVPEKGWTDGLALSPRHDGTMNTRHTPTLYGAAFYPDLYWDGRSRGLETQILAAWRGQMGADPDAIAKELADVPRYAAAFQKSYEGPVTGDRIVKALATFVRTIHAGDTPWDRSPQDPAAAPKTPIARGFQVFSTSGCVLCHTPPLFSDTQFHNVGIGSDSPKPDMGRGRILADAATKGNQPVTPEMERLMGAFKTPSLRGAALSGPYFHDGSAKTLDEAVDVMLKGGIDNKTKDPLLKPQTLTPEQRKDLMAFLQALTPNNKPYQRPKPW